MKKFILLLVLFSLTLICACGKVEGTMVISTETPKAPETETNKEGNVTELKDYETENPVVKMTIKDYGDIIIELYPDVAPNTVNNFISLVKKGFYDNNTVHRMIPGFVIQGGDPEGQGSGGPGYSIKGEFTANNFKNDLKHTEGILSMARTSVYDSAGSQFFIMIGEAPHLDGLYAAFGKVIDGYDVCEEIAKIKDYNPTTGKLDTNLVIEKAVVDLKGKTYPEPAVIYN